MALLFKLITKLLASGTHALKYHINLCSLNTGLFHVNLRPINCIYFALDGGAGIGLGAYAAGSVAAVDEDDNHNVEPAAKRQRDEDEEAEEKSSPVWKVAEKLNESEAKCKICKKVYKLPTTNVIDHIVTKHRDTDGGKELKAEMERKLKKREEKQRKKEGKAITKYFKPISISKPEKARIDEVVVEYVVARNEPFHTVEDHFFRKLMHTVHSGYTLMSEMQLARQVDAKIEVVKNQLFEEIQEDVKVHKSVSLTSDGGTGGDQNKTKKNTLTLSRITEQFELKTDTIALSKAVGSQTGPVLRAFWKNELLKVGYTADWRVLVTTDAAPNEQSARALDRHDDIGLMIDYSSDCVDHQVSKHTVQFNKSIFQLVLDPVGAQR